MVGLSGKEMWQKIEGLGPMNKRHWNLEEISIEGKVYNDIYTVLKGWETQFVKLYVGLPPDMPDYGRKCVASTLDTSVLNNPVDYKEVKLAVMQAKSGKAVLVDKLPNEILRNASTLECLTRIFNICLSKSLIPKMFKGKGKDQRDPRNYRPVSLICNPCKIFSNILNNRLLHFLENNELLAEEQNGFRKGRSCEDHIFVLASIIKKNFN